MMVQNLSCCLSNDLRLYSEGVKHSYRVQLWEVLLVEDIPSRFEYARNRLTLSIDPRECQAPTISVCKKIWKSLA